MITNFIPVFSLKVEAGQEYNTTGDFLNHDTFIIGEACSISVNSTEYFAVEAYSRISVGAFAATYVFNVPVMVLVGDAV